MGMGWSVAPFAPHPVPARAGQCLPFRPGFSEGGQLRPEPLARLALPGHPLGAPAAGGDRAEPGVWKGSRGGAAQPRVLLVFSFSFELRKGGHMVGAGTRRLLSSPRRLFCSAPGPDPSQPGPQEASSHQAAGAGQPAAAGKRPSSWEDSGRDGLPRPVEAGLGAPALGCSCWRWASALTLGGPGEELCLEETPGRVSPDGQGLWCRPRQGFLQGQHHSFIRSFTRSFRGVLSVGGGLAQFPESRVPVFWKLSLGCGGGGVAYPEPGSGGRWGGEGGQVSPRRALNQPWWRSISRGGGRPWAGSGAGGSRWA